MPLGELHRQVATIALRAAADNGFALGGGGALLAHGVISRYTADVDLFTDEADGVSAAAAAVEKALRAAGFTAARQDMTGGLADLFEGIGEGLAEWVVTSPEGGEMVLQMAYFLRGRNPVVMDIGPVLDIEDAVGSKIAAMAGRAEARDYMDAAAALERYTPGQLIEFARRVDSGLTDEDYAEAGAHLDRMSDARFARLGLEPADIARLRARMSVWPRPS